MKEEAGENKWPELEKIEGLEFWNKVESTVRANTKDVQVGGRKFTAIDAYSQIKKATEHWGPFGNAWGIKEESFKVIQEIFILYKGTFYCPISEFVIFSSILLYSKTQKVPDVDFAKKVKTDALTKALSLIGFNADVFLGKFDGNKYIEPPKPGPVNGTGKLNDANKKKAYRLHAYLMALNNEDEVAVQQDVFKETKKKKFNLLTNKEFELFWGTYEERVKQFEVPNGTLEQPY